MISSTTPIPHSSSLLPLPPKPSPPPSCQYILLSLFNFFHSCISLDYLFKIFIIALYILAVILSIIGLGLGDLIMFTILDPRIKGFDHSWCIYNVILLVKELRKTFQKFSFIIMSWYLCQNSEITSSCV
jgi:hypothetical protein